MFAQFARWLRPSSEVAAAHRLYIALVAQARQPFFYETLHVPDSVDGRFDLILLHVFLFTHRLRHEESGPQESLATAITDTFFEDMDRSLREMGVGDMSVGKKIKVMAHALNGRFLAYNNALPDPEALRFALTRNIYSSASPEGAHIDTLCRYVSDAVHGLARQPIENFMQGNLIWPAISR